MNAPRLSVLAARMCRVSEARALASPAPTSHQGTLGLVEGVAHELAHQLEAGRNYEDRLDARYMENAEANVREAATLRIEVAALADLGVRLSMRRLWRDAAWRGERPRFADVARQLTEREQRCVRAFLRIVQDGSA